MFRPVSRSALRTLSRLLSDSPVAGHHPQQSWPNFLEDTGLLYSPHTSAGRLPTEAGLRSLCRHGLLEVGHLADEEAQQHRKPVRGARQEPAASASEEATMALSGLSRCAGLVIVPKQDRPPANISNSVPPRRRPRARGFLVTEDGLVENRVVEVPLGLPPSALISATNYLSARLRGPHDRGSARRDRRRRSPQTRLNSTN